MQETKSEEEPKVIEKVEEKKDDKKEDLKEYSDKVKKRIDKLTFQIREAERREKAALEYAKGLKTKYDTIEKKFEETDSNYLKEYDSRIDAEREKVKNALKVALESQDVDKILKHKMHFLDFQLKKKKFL